MSSNIEFHLIWANFQLFRCWTRFKATGKERRINWPFDLKYRSNSTLQKLKKIWAAQINGFKD